MAKIEIDTNKGHQDVDIQVRDMETQALLNIYDMFEQNPTVFQMVADELTYRARTESKLEYLNQVGEIRERLR